MRVDPEYARRRALIEDAARREAAKTVIGLMLRIAAASLPRLPGVSRFAGYRAALLGSTHLTPVRA